MEQASPARLYATLVGATLVGVGILGFFYSASFGSPGAVDKMLGIFAVNGWDNVLHIVTGALGLLVAGYAARQYALWVGALYVGVAAWGFVVGSGEAILGFLPVNTGDNLLHLVLGALGLAAAAATPASRAATEATTTTGKDGVTA
ncbi:MAG TPA: DUF4383 domain-containing protein [Solirubrobacterales bacterium]|nr:DUF4383 domain-containing protein [Solirubrobacterales bacterium]